ncbi:hypothetical protein [Nonomuraea monospora]|uniref:hypothetical protein n=1 Tax=Nonomuraea monospora TaxID=568818 RepID=UPI0031D348F2
MKHVICNPVDLAYRYQETRLADLEHGIQREAADPSVVLFRGRYYLFASMSRGFWHSADLVAWSYRPTEKLPPFDYAPDVREVNGALYISASRREQNCPFFRSENPLADDFTEVTPGSFLQRRLLPCQRPPVGNAAVVRDLGHRVRGAAARRLPR